MDVSSGSDKTNFLSRRMYDLVICSAIDRPPSFLRRMFDYKIVRIVSWLAINLVVYDIRPIFWR